MNLWKNFLKIAAHFGSEIADSPDITLFTKSFVVSVILSNPQWVNVDVTEARTRLKRLCHRCTQTQNETHLLNKNLS